MSLGKPRHPFFFLDLIAYSDSQSFSLNDMEFYHLVDPIKAWGGAFAKDLHLHYSPSA